nr:MAG TPA: hypothetical protein [Bacteriophage sp.]
MVETSTYVYAIMWQYFLNLLQSKNRNVLCCCLCSKRKPERGSYRMHFF